MVKLTGHIIENGKIVEIKQEVFTCICIKGYFNSFDKGSVYEFVDDVQEYKVYIDEYLFVAIDKNDFKENFSEISEYREQRLKYIL